MDGKHGLGDLVRREDYEVIAAEVERLKTALERGAAKFDAYARHNDNCWIETYEDSGRVRACSCGMFDAYVEMIAALAAPVPQGKDEGEKL